ncbi:MAG TPA: molybdate ABC transporter permease subunit [Tepidisphaeraceae bacterium]|jgi:molybdate transport system permease protein
MDWDALVVTLKLASATTLILFVIGVPVAYWISITPRRWIRTLVEASIALPILLPPTVLGFYLLYASGPRSPLGAMILKLTGHALPFSFSGILLGSVIYNLPFAIRPFSAGFSAVDRRLIEASWCLGVSPILTFARITLPLSQAAILTGIVLTFAHTVGEFGVVLMIGGDIAGHTRTLSVSIFDSVQAMDYAAAGQTSIILVGFAFVTLFITYSLQRRVLPR